MNADVLDIHQTLEYRLATAIVRLLPIGLLLIFLSLVIFALVDPAREPVWTFIGIGVCMTMGIGVIGLALWTRSSPGKPLFTLSPVGIHFRIAWVKEFLIPWHEIKGVDTIDVETGYWSMLWSTHTLRYNDMTFHGVTAVLVPKQFYEFSDLRRLIFPERTGLGRQLHPEGLAGPGRTAPRDRIVPGAGIARSGRGALERVPRSTGHRAGEIQRAARDGGGKDCAAGEACCQTWRCDGRVAEIHAALGNGDRRRAADRNRRRVSQYRRDVEFAGTG